MFDARSRVLLDSLPHLIGYTDCDRKIRYINRAYEAYLGKSSREILGKHVREVWGDRLFDELRSYQEQALSGSQVAFSKSLLDPWGRPAKVRIELIPDLVEQRIAGYITIIQDMSLETNEEYRTDRLTLARELDHRINNSLQVIQSFLALESCTKEERSPESILTALKTRVDSLAIVYNLLRSTASPTGSDAALVLDRVAAIFEAPVTMKTGTGILIPNSQIDAFVFISEELLRSAERRGKPLELELSRSGDGIVLAIEAPGPEFDSLEQVWAATTVSLVIIKAFASSCGATFQCGSDEKPRFCVTFPASRNNAIPGE